MPLDYNILNKGVSLLDNQRLQQDFELKKQLAALQTVAQIQNAARQQDMLAETIRHNQVSEGLTNKRISAGLPYVDPDTGEVVPGGTPIGNPAGVGNPAGGQQPEQRIFGFAPQTNINPTNYRALLASDKKQQEAEKANAAIANNILGNLSDLEPNLDKVTTGSNATPLLQWASKLNPSGDTATAYANIDKGTNALATELGKFQYMPGQRGSVLGLQTILASKPGVNQPERTNKNMVADIKTRVSDYQLTTELNDAFRQANPYGLLDNRAAQLDDALKTIYPLKTQKGIDVSFNKDNIQKIRDAIPDALANPDKYFQAAKAVQAGKSNPLDSATNYQDPAIDANEQFGSPQMPAPPAIPGLQNPDNPAAQVRSVPVTGASNPPRAAIQHLMANPSLRNDFDAKYGAGASAKILGK